MFFFLFVDLLDIPPHFDAVVKFDKTEKAGIYAHDSNILLILTYIEKIFSPEAC